MNISEVTEKRVRTIIVMVTKESQKFLKKFWKENFIILDKERKNILNKMNYKIYLPLA